MSDPDEISFDAIVKVLNDRGHFAYVEQTGGGCATIIAGPVDNRVHCGPGWFNRPMFREGAGNPFDLYVGYSPWEGDGNEKADDPEFEQTHTNDPAKIADVMIRYINKEV